MGSTSWPEDTPFGRRVLPTLIDQIAAQEPDRECMSTPRSDKPSDGWKVVTWRDMANAINRCAHRVVELCGKPEENSFPTIAYLGSNDIRYTVTMLACVKAGYKSLFISPRNTKEGQLNLFKSTDCNVIAYTASMKDIVTPLLKERQMRAIEVSPFDEWFPEHDVPHFPYKKTFDESAWDPLCVLHTSGSTGLPKPIIVRMGMQAVSDAFRVFPECHGQTPEMLHWADESRRVFMAMPMFHMAAVLSTVALVFWNKTPMAYCVSGRPVSADLVLECLENAEADTAFLPPSVIEDLSQSEEGIHALAKLHSVSFGGGNLARESGNRLIKNGATLRNLIGATEFAPFPTYAKDDKYLWQYFHYNKEAFGCEFRKYGGDDDVYELVIVRQKENKSNPGWQGVFYTFPELDEWSTKDLYRPHPTLEDHWIYHGRADNIIVFSNGEKLNPVTIEEIVSDHAALKGAMVVGSEQFQAGLLIEPHVYPTTEQEKQALLDSVWPLVEQANEETVQHGRIARDMVHLCSPDKPFPRAGKGTIQRAAAVKQYKEEIAQIYANKSEDRPAQDAPKINVNSEESLTASIVEIFREHLQAHSLEADIDFFAAGIDSLGVMNASKLLRAGLGASGYEVDSKTMAPRVIYRNSTPQRLASYIFNTIVQGSSGTQSEDEQQQEAMHQMHKKYTQNLIKAKPNRPEPRNENQVVILTGSTGMLGSYLLHLMGCNPRVAKIICLNRAADGGRSQQVKALADRGLDVGIIDTKAEFYHADLSKPDLGLGPEVYARLQAEADRVIHNAWPVNFNIPIESFEPFLAGVRYMGDLAATAERRVAVTFISSIAVADRWNPEKNGAEKVPERRFEDMSLAAGGYGRSKMVGSLIIEDAAAKDAGDFPYAVVRVGQVAGPESEQGMWNRQEWLPSIIASSLYLKALPSELGGMDRVDWTPAERIAKLILEAAGVSRVVAQADEINGYYHGVNPHETSWPTLAAAVQEFYGKDRIAELIPFHEWVDRLEKTQADGEESIARNPGVKLIDSYRGMASAPMPVVYNMKETMERCPIARETKAITPELMKLFCKQWGF